MSCKTTIDSHDKLLNAIKNKKSLLCVGLDTDLDKIPANLHSNKLDNLTDILDFNKLIVEQTQDFAAAYKINFAFYEKLGEAGFELIRKTLEFIPKDIFTIADAKRGDIGNTSKAYAKMAFENFNFDSITVSPYMGIDSVAPFLEDKSKMIFILALTSNPGSFDFQRLMSEGKAVYQHVIERFTATFAVKNLGFVIGATHPQELKHLRTLIPDNVVLIPGVGAQGGNVEELLESNNNCPAIINVSRAIIHPTTTENDFAKAVHTKARDYQLQFNKIL